MSFSLHPLLWWRMVRLLLLCVATVGLAIAAGCSGKNTPAEKDPHYLRGIRMVQDGEHDEAVSAFENCLRRNPACAKAHLQLGMLYEDCIGDLVSAMYHYDRYLLLCPKGEEADLVRRWRDRAETAYYEQLAEVRPRHVPAGSAKPVLQVATPGVPAPTVAAPAPPKEENRLSEHMKQLQAEVAAIREKLIPRQGESPAPPAGSDETPPRPVSQRPAVAGGERHYTVEKGDTLSAISRKFYGTSTQWAKIRDANRDIVGSGERLKPGMQLRIPDLNATATPKG